MSAPVAADTTVAEALAWRLIELEERIATTRAAMTGLRRWSQFVGWDALAQMRGYLWSCLEERRSLLKRLAQETGR